MRPLRLLSVLAITAALSTSALHAQRDTLCRDRVPTESSISIAAPGEHGTRLIISGRVLAGDDRTPVVGARLLAFHTDDQGYYSVGGMDEQNARLCGVLSTDAAGRYRIDTIMPAHYATGGPPAHIHFELTLPGERMRRLTLNFEGDPELHGQPAGEIWETIRRVEERDGSLHVERDFWLR